MKRCLNTFQILIMVISTLVHVQIQKGDRESEPPPPPPPPIKNIGFLSNTGPYPLKKAQSYQASTQCWAIIGPPAKRHLMAFLWRADDGPLLVPIGSSFLSSKKKKRKKKEKEKNFTFQSKSNSISMKFMNQQNCRFV